MVGSRSTGSMSQSITPTSVESAPAPDQEARHLAHPLLGGQEVDEQHQPSAQGLKGGMISHKLRGGGGKAEARTAEANQATCFIRKL
jgi:hypothetical protein